jgi:hypothetical protein
MKSIMGWEEDGNAYMGQNGCCYDSPDKWIVLDLCGLCGCGDDKVKEDIIEEFCNIANGKHIMPVTLYKELILHVLDHAGLTTHGSNIYYSFLTEKGKKAYAELSKEPKAYWEDDKR